MIIWYSGLLFCTTQYVVYFGSVCVYAHWYRASPDTLDITSVTSRGAQSRHFCAKSGSGMSTSSYIQVIFTWNLRLMPPNIARARGCASILEYMGQMQEFFKGVKWYGVGTTEVPQFGAKAKFTWGV